MAEIIESTTEKKTISDSRPLKNAIILGVILGLAYYSLTIFINNLIIGQIFCHGSNEANICQKSMVISGDVSTILIATAGIVAMLRLYMVRPLIVCLATAVSLWGLSNWLNGVAVVESLFWSILLYSISYVLFSWIVRFMKVAPVIILVAIIVVIVRLAASL